jgi:hypothetical protein
MNTELLIIKRIISELPDAEREATKLAHLDLKATMTKHGQAGTLALMLLAIELRGE